MKRGDIIVFRYPVDIQQTFVKRVIGVPGDHIRLVNKKSCMLNGHALDEPYMYHKTEYIDSYRDNFPSEPNVHVSESGAATCSTNHVQNGEVVVPPGTISPWATTAIPRSTAATGALCRARTSSASR